MPEIAKLLRRKMVKHVYLLHMHARPGELQLLAADNRVAQEAAHVMQLDL